MIDVGAVLRESVGRGAQQQPQELAMLIGIVFVLQPSVVLEVGSAGGGSLLAWARAILDPALMVSVDVVAPRVSAADLRPHSVEVVTGDSHDPLIVTEVRRILAGRAVDFLFLDGDHYGDGPRLDVESYVPLVGEGGIVAIHDVNPKTWENFSVPDLWERAGTEYPSISWVSTPGVKGFGVGILRVEGCS